eukprot:CAMPEP_0181187088 /NCGR_PEP_ID=MMETSP1096-20121128/10378_1 /TAXON_ID=156174 ORGANISM="Chrysochromulina ericina, Strain CCMP281" /NCGR_SAMPLE_ID=MMETSP1096 /ASSEMBLY_ACC=CAM_ASM_000453 /LENGTH=120 /DNA_ID=CAMNT_0023276023 /DNA_START=861 /DNA_END=1223 /DNA_ORIENTATION=-
MQQVFAGPELVVVLTNRSRQLILPPRSQILLHQIGRRIDDVDAQCADVTLQHSVLTTARHAHHEKDVLLPTSRRAATWRPAPRSVCGGGGGVRRVIAHIRVVPPAAQVSSRSSEQALDDL